MEAHMAESFHGEYDVFVGRNMGGRAYTVTPEMVRLYEHGTDDRNPWYSGDSPLGGALAPALLFHSEVYRDLSWYLPNLIGNLHAKQEWEIFHPMRAGDTVRSHSTVVERYVRRNREYVVNEVLFTDTDGRWLQRSRTHQSFLMDPGSSSANTSVSGGGQVGAAFVVDKDREKRADRKFVVGEGSGPDLTPAEKTITHAMCIAFSGPHKSYHTDQEMARALGFPDIVVQGMMSVCFISDIMTRNFGVGWFCGGKLNVSLVNVVWPNDRLHVRGKVRDAMPEGAKTRIVCDVWCEKDDGVKTVVGTASALRS
jgi:3-hydroxybutyryl-CoA dehydratase